MGSRTDQLPSPFREASIHNVVITTHVGCRLDLRWLARNLLNANFNPRRFAAVILRCHAPYTTALLFNTGKVVCTGSRTIAEAHRALSGFVERLVSVGVRVSASAFKVENIVGASALVESNKELRIGRLIGGNDVEYEPELFPGMSRRFTMRDDTVVLCIVFTSGKMILTGNGKPEHLEEVMTHVTQWLRPAVVNRAEVQGRKRRRSAAVEAAV